MNARLSRLAAVIAWTLFAGLAGPVRAQDEETRRAFHDPGFQWQVVVNNGVQVPGDPRPFNSYNPPSLNTDRLVVFRGRTKGGPGGEPAHGVFTRDMALGTPIVTIFDRQTQVTYPNNLGTTIVEPPSFPRIDMWSSAVASRANHPPVWAYVAPGDTEESRAGTTGIYTNPFSSLLTGASNLGAVSGFEVFAVPGLSPVTRFDVFPGAPAVTDGATIVFKGNYSVPDPDDPSALIGRTGVYYRVLADAPAGGSSPVIVIADSETVIPGTTTNFGSTAPPSAARGVAVFTGWDNEWRPTEGGIYMAPLSGPRPPLTPLIEIGDAVPDEAEGIVFRNVGEGLSFDGRFVAFWATWGTDTRTVILQCPDEGNRERLEYCRSQHPDGYAARVPVHQGIFVHDIETGQTTPIVKTPDDFTDFVYWNFSGKVPGSHGEEEGEPARWRSASFAAVSGLADGSLADPFFHTVFKARTGEASDAEPPVDGVYLRAGSRKSPLAVVVTDGLDGSLFDPAAVDPETGQPLPVTDMAIEREGFRGPWLAVSVKMGTEEAGWAGIYLGTVDGSRMPSASPDAYATSFATPLVVEAPGVLVNDDAGGIIGVAAELGEGVADGVLALDARGGFVYTPDPAFAGTDRFTYRVRNSLGVCEPAVVSIRVEAPTEPQPPTDLHVEAIRGHRVTLSWNPPRLGPAPTGYTVEGGSAPGEAGAAILVGEVPGVTFEAPRGRFHVRVRTRSGALLSAASIEIQVLVDVPASPSTPDSFLALVNGNSLALSWRSTYVPSEKGGGGEPTGFVLDVAGPARMSMALGMTDKASFEDVPPGSYTLSLRAVNGAGSSAATVPVEVTLPGSCSGAPLAPANVAAYRVKNTIHVAWDPPAAGPAPTGYIVTVGGSLAGRFETTAREMSGAVAAGVYTVSLSSINPCGESEATVPHTVRIP